MNHTMVLLDNSGSTAPFINNYVTLINNILEKRFNKDRITLATFNMHLNFICVREVVSKPIENEVIKPYGGTSLFDCLGEFLQRMRASEGVHNGKKTVIIITDGDDTTSQFATIANVETQIKLLKDLGWTFIFLGVFGYQMKTGKRLGCNSVILYEQSRQSLESVSNALIKFLEPEQQVEDLDLRFERLNLSSE